MITRNELLDCLKGIGIDITVGINEDINVTSFLEDSIHFISTLVHIEQTFNIEITEEYLQNDIFDSLNNLLEMVNILKDMNNEKVME